MPKGEKGVSNRRDNYQCIEYYLCRYPHLSEEQCEQLRKERIQKSIKRRPDNTGISNPAHKSKVSEEERKRRSPMCIEYWMWKHPDLNVRECEELLEEHKQRIKNKLKDKTNQPKCVDYWVARGYTREEAKHIISESQKTFSLEKCISKYGEEHGRQVFEERQRKWVKSLRKSFMEHGDSRNPQSLLAETLITALCKELSIKYPYREKYISDSDGNHFAYDFTYGNKMIEINGDYWHCNPLMYKEDYFNKSKRLYAKEIWEYDARKAECAKKHGYKLLVVWENEYNQNPEDTIKKCLDFLKND